MNDFVIIINVTSRANALDRNHGLACLASSSTTNAWI